MRLTEGNTAQYDPDTGFVWLSPNSEPREDLVFNEPWMSVLNDELLFRYWQKKGSPGYLVVWKNGIKCWYRYYERSGAVLFIPTPMF